MSVEMLSNVDGSQLILKPQDESHDNRQAEEGSKNYSVHEDPCCKLLRMMGLGEVVDIEI